MPLLERQTEPNRGYFRRLGPVNESRLHFGANAGRADARRRDAGDALSSSRSGNPVAAGGTFTTKELHPMVAEALNGSTDDYRLSSLRYELSKLRAKGLVEKIPRSRRYRLLQDGYRLSLVFFKLFERLYAPLTAGLLDPGSGEATLPDDRISHLDGRYLAVSTALENRLEAA
jgi:hypothetical protein